MSWAQISVTSQEFIHYYNIHTIQIDTLFDGEKHIYLHCSDLFVKGYHYRVAYNIKIKYMRYVGITTMFLSVRRGQIGYTNICIWSPPRYSHTHTRLIHCAINFICCMARWSEYVSLRKSLRIFYIYKIIPIMMNLISCILWFLIQIQ